MDQEDAVREHHVFWMLVKGCRDRPVGRVYLAIQAALAFDRGRVDVSRLMGEMMARGQRSMTSTGEAIGAAGLAYFHWLYEVELAEAGDAEVHSYRFRRRHDGKEIIALLATAANPLGLYFQQSYAREKRALDKRRQRFLAAARPRSSPPERGAGAIEKDQ